MALENNLVDLIVAVQENTDALNRLLLQYEKNEHEVVKTNLKEKKRKESAEPKPPAATNIKVAKEKDAKVEVSDDEKAKKYKKLQSLCITLAGEFTKIHKGNPKMAKKVGREKTQDFMEKITGVRTLNKVSIDQYEEFAEQLDERLAQLTG